MGLGDGPAAGAVGLGTTEEEGFGTTAVFGVGRAEGAGQVDGVGRAGDGGRVARGAGVNVVTPVPMTGSVGLGEAEGVGTDRLLRNRATTCGAAVQATTVVATPARTTTIIATARRCRARAAGSKERRDRGLKCSGRRSLRGNCESSSARIRVAQARSDGSRGVSGPLARIAFETLWKVFPFGLQQGIPHGLERGAEPGGHRPRWDP